MKIKFLRDYHGPETGEIRQLQGVIVDFNDLVAQNFIDRKIAVSVEPVIKVEEKDIFEEVAEPAIKVIEPKIIVKRGRKAKS